MIQPMIPLVFAAAAVSVFFLLREKIECEQKSKLQGKIKLTEKTKFEEKTEHKELTLALVLKGKEAAKIQSQQLTQEELITLLEKASYFFCTSQAQIGDTLNKLNLVEDKIDPDSEQQQVLITIQFKHSDQIPQHGFRNKLELNNFLRKVSNEFEIKEKKVLTKISGLSKAGFIRT